MLARISLALVTMTMAAANPLPADLTGETIAIWNTTGDANQGVGVDEFHYYAVTNRRITKMDKISKFSCSQKIKMYRAMDRGWCS